MKFRLVPFTGKVYFESSLGMVIGSLTAWTCVALFTGNDAQGISEFLAFLGGTLPVKEGFPGIGAFIEYALPLSAALFTAILLYNTIIASPISLMTDLRVPDIDIDLRATFLGVVVAPVVEELLLRGVLLWFPLAYLTGSESTYFLVGLSSFAFAVLHVWNYGGSLLARCVKLVIQLSAGYALAFMFLRYGLVAAIGLHAIHNALAFFGAKISGKIMS